MHFHKQYLPGGQKDCTTAMAEWTLSEWTSLWLLSDSEQGNLKQICPETRSIVYIQSVRFGA
ncbi:hypothetical protein [Egbenema bharatensis]|uniref:hypothetical protein n=1 Tax=Egbenema bharatensis TaxID=3463334 RepID=UPI003A878FD0